MIKELYTYWKVRIQDKYEYRKEVIPVEKQRATGYNVMETYIALDEEPDLVASRDPDGLHRLIIDVDFDVTLLESRTPGHFHLYFDGMKPINFHKYQALLTALADAGIIEPGYAKVSIKRGMTMLRYSPETVLPSDQDFGVKGNHFMFSEKDLDPAVNDGSTFTHATMEPEKQIFQPHSARGFVRTMCKSGGLNYVREERFADDNIPF